MNPNQTQGSNPQDMTPEEAKAGLGLATRLNEQMLVANAPQQGAPQPDTQQQPDLMGELDKVRTDFQTELGGLKQTTQDMIKAEIDKLRDDIQSAIQEETNNEQA